MTKKQQDEYRSMRRLMRMLCYPKEGFSRSVTAALISELTEHQQEAVYLYYVQQMPMREVAEIQGLDVSTVSRSLARARKRLYRVLGYLPRFQNEDTRDDFVRLMEDR